MLKSLKCLKASWAHATPANRLAFVSVNPVGDACVNDFDGDDVPDDDDMCPHVTHISKTSFLNYFTVDLYPGHGEPSPEWRVAKMVCKSTRSLIFNCHKLDCP